MSYWKRWLTASAMMFLFFTVFAAGYILGGHSPSTFVKAQTTDQPSDTDELFAPFWEAWSLLHDNYVDPLDDNVLMEGALTGMMAAVDDPHTDYMDPETFQRVNESMYSAYDGIGATVRQNEDSGGLELITIFEESPAGVAGLRPGDQIIEIEGENITHLTQSEIIAQVRGPAGTTVRLGIARGDEAELLEFDVMRARINTPSVIYRIEEGNIGYLQLMQFSFSSAQDMRDALEEMDANNLDGLILDMRGNPGGYLTTSIDVASAFFAEGPVLIERGPRGEFEHLALGNPVAPDVPMVVLVNEGSASASELVAGALQDRGRATIVGMPTFGKGSVQTWRELVNGGGVRITISRWYTPNGTSVSESGITPDVEVPLEYDAEEDYQLQAALDVLQGSVEADPVVRDGARTAE